MKKNANSAAIVRAAQQLSRHGDGEGRVTVNVFIEMFESELLGLVRQATRTGQTVDEVIETLLTEGLGSHGLYVPQLFDVIDHWDEEAKKAR